MKALKILSYVGKVAGLVAALNASRAITAFPIIDHQIRPDFFSERSGTAF